MIATRIPPAAKPARGFNLIEMLFTLGLLAVLASLAMPSFGSAVARHRLRGAADALAGQWTLAAQQAANRGGTLFVVARTGADWCVGLAESAAVACAQAPTRLHAHDFPGVVLSRAGGRLGEPVTEARATALLASAQGDQLLIAMTPLGRPSLCSPSAATGFARCAD